MNFEIVWINAESSESDYSKELKKMPWYSLPYADSSANTKLNTLFKVDGIPTASV